MSPDPPASGQVRLILRIRPRRATSPAPLETLFTKSCLHPRTPREKGLSSMKQDGGLRSSPPSKTLLVPRRDKDVVAPEIRGKPARPAATPAPGGDFTSPAQRARDAKGREARLNTREWTQESLRLGHSPSPGPPPSSPLADRKVSQPAPPHSPAPEVIGGSCCRAARRRGGSPRAERPESSSTSSRRPGSTAACRTRRLPAREPLDYKSVEHYPAGASSAAGSEPTPGLRPAAVQVSSPLRRPVRASRPGGGGGARRGDPAQTQGPDAESAPPAFCPGTSCGTSPSWNRGAVFAAVRASALWRGRLRRGP